MNEEPLRSPDPSPPRRERKLALAAVLPALVVVLLWCVFLLDQGLELSLYRFGILPRTVDGLVGILASPVVHGDLDHLLNNSIPAFVLGWALMYFFPHLTGRVVLGSWLLSGIWVWISARGNYHIGASGVVYGMAAFLFTSGILRQQRMLMGVALLVVFLYGSMLWGVFPLFPRISWESHFWGAATGVAMAFAFRHIPPAVSDPREVKWEEEGSEPEEGMGPPAPDEEDEQGGRTWRSSNSWERFN